MADNTAFAQIKQTRKNMIMHQNLIVSPKMREKGTETLPKLFNKKEKHTNYALYKHQHLGVESDQQENEVFGEEKFTNV